jgi:hypothetical protein
LNGLTWAIIIQEKIETLNVMTLTWMHNQLLRCTKNISFKMKEVECFEMELGQVRDLLCNDLNVGLITKINA